MKISRLYADDEAVSPVIGVILMVAITVVLAAVIASFVMGVPNQVEPTKSATFSVDYQEVSGGPNTLTLVHEQGDILDGDRVIIKGKNLGGDAGKTWIDAGGGVDPSGSRIINGKSLMLSGVGDDFELRLVYDGGDTSATLQEEQGPAA